MHVPIAPTEADGRRLCVDLEPHSTLQVLNTMLNNKIGTLRFSKKGKSHLQTKAERSMTLKMILHRT